MVKPTPAWSTEEPTEPGFYWLFWDHPIDPELTCVKLMREEYQPATDSLGVLMPGDEIENTVAEMALYGGTLYWMPIPNIPEPPLLWKRER